MPTVMLDLADAIGQAKQQYHRLLLLVGPSGCGKTGLLKDLAHGEGCTYLNLNLALSQRMLELTRTQRPRQVDRLMDELIAAQGSDVVVLDNLEILFDPALKLDPLRLLQGASRNRTIVAAWSGEYTQESLTYAQPHHPEYRTYREFDAVVVLMKQDETSQI